MQNIQVIQTRILWMTSIKLCNMLLAGMALVLQDAASCQQSTHRILPQTHGIHVAAKQISLQGVLALTNRLSAQGLICSNNCINTNIQLLIY